MYIYTDRHPKYAILQQLSIIHIHCNYDNKVQFKSCYYRNKKNQCTVRSNKARTNIHNAETGTHDCWSAILKWIHLEYHRDGQCRHGIGHVKRQIKTFYATKAKKQKYTNKIHRPRQYE